LGLGIDLSPEGVTPNDERDPDTGANDAQNFPVLNSATNTTVEGTLSSTANTTFILEFFSNTACDPSGHGEGEMFIGSTMVMTGLDGTASFMATFSTRAPSNRFITATATDPNGNTSEFSPCLAVQGTNQPPNAVDDRVEIDCITSCGTLIINVLANDSDPDSDPLTIIAVTQGSGGRVAIINNGTRVTFTPTSNFTGFDMFTYTISDGNGGTDTATVMMMYVPPPKL
jgi:hypothetical protein